MSEPNNSDLQILIEAALDFEKSLQIITAQMSQLRNKFKDYQIKITAGLDKTASDLQIKNDLKQLSKDKRRIEVVGDLDRDKTKQNVEAALKRLKDTELKLAGIFDTESLKKQMQEVRAEADVEVNGTDKVDDLRDKMDKAGRSATGMAANLYLARTALQALRKAAHEAIETVTELDKAATDLAIVTGSQGSEMYALLSDYNELAKQLGATTTQVSDAATSWLRQGMNAAETAVLIEQSMVLSKVAMMESETATKNLTSAMRGYGMAVQDVSGIVDKLSALDSKAAVTASDLAVAMSQTASSANIGGVSMDRLLGYLATVQEVTQRSAETIGQSFKTIFARIGNIKLGNFLDDDGEDLSDVETVLKSYGIALRSTTGDFRNFSTVLDELSEKWQSFAAVDKRAIAQAFAGTRQQENFLVLMENYGKAIEYTKVAADSAGTAMQKFAAYEDSVEAKANTFAAAVEGLTMDTIDSVLVKDLIDTGTAIIEIADKTNLLKAALLGLGAGATLKGITAISDKFSNAKQSVLNLGEAVQTLRDVQDIEVLSGETIHRLGTFTKGLNDEQLRLVLSSQQLSTAQMQAILTASGLSEAEATAKLQSIGLTTAEGAATTATVGLSGAMLGLGTAIKAAFASNPIGMTMLAVSAAYTVFSGVASIFDDIIVSAEDAYDTAEELRQSYDALNQKVEELGNTLSDNTKRIRELSDLYDNDTITLIEQDELLRLQQTNAELEIAIQRKKELAEQDAAKANAGYAESYDKRSFISTEKMTVTSDGYAVVGETIGYDEHVQEVIRSYSKLNDLKDTGVELSETQNEQYAESRTELVRLAEELDGDFLAKYIGEDEYTAEWKGLLDLINQTIYPVEYFSQKLTELPKDCYKTMQELGNGAALSADQVAVLAKQYPALTSWMKESGYTADDVAKHFNSLSVEQKKSADGVEDLSSKVAQFSVDKFSDLESKVGMVTDALSSFSENGIVASSEFEKFEEGFGNLSGFEEFKRILGNSSSSMEECREAANRLLSEYVNMTGILNTITEENASWVESQLEAMGVENAHQIVLDHLTASKISAEVATNGLTNASWEEISAFAQEKFGADATTGALRQFAAQQYNAELAVINFSTASASAVGNLIAYAQAVGVAADASSALYQMQSLANRKSSGSLTFYEVNHYDELMSDYANRVKKEITSALTLDLGVGGAKGGGGGSSKAVEEYIADIDEFREALERLRKAQEVRSNVKLRIDESDNLREQVILEKQLIGAYEREQEALVNLNNQRSKAITSGAQALRELGFSVSYNAEANELWIDNMEHLNELTATSKGEYGSLQEATNALRKDTEELIDSLTELNDDNRDAAENWRELKGSIKDAREQIKSLLNDVVKQASEAVDSMQNVYDTLHSAADEYAESGYITVDVLQSIVDLGVQYLSYLIDENGQLVINEKTVKDVIAAKTQQLAIESSLSYIESLRIAKMENDIETLENLLNATEQATDATWGFVYATLALSGLSDQEQQIALENINALRALADSAADGIGKTGSALKDSLSDILKYVMDMLKQQISDQVDALEDMKDTYSDIIDMKKKSLEASKDEADYEKNRAKKLKEIASLQARIDILSLDDSRSAKAERSKLLEELAALQEELAENQADRALEATKEALDEMEDAYHQERDKEIEILENSISSYQKLYDMAIAYIEDHWNTLYDELISWNTEYGNVLDSKITTAWDNCLEAAKRYGSFVSALENVGSDSGGQHYVVGNTNYDSSFTKTDGINATVAQMKENSALWVTASPEQRKKLSAENVRLGKVELAQYGVEADIDQNGVWYLKDGRKLYDVYHTGGVVGRKGSLEDNEVLAKLEKDEVVLTRKMWNNVIELIHKDQQYSKMSDALKDSFGILKSPLISEMLRSGSSSTNNVTTNNNQPTAINFGDTIINGANPDAVEKHKAVDREMMNEIAKWALGRRV